MTRRFSTEDVEKKSRLDYWQYVCGELIGSLELGDYEAADFEASIDLMTVANLKIGCFSGARQTLHRKNSTIRSADSDDYIVLLESDKTFNNEHCGRQRSGRNGIVLIDITQPYYGNHPEGLEVIDVFVPRKDLESALGPARLAAGMTIEPDQASHPILSTFLRSLQQHGSTLDPLRAERLSSIAVDLIAAAFAETIVQAPQQMSAAATLCRAQSYVASHLGVSSLGMKDIASAIGISVRRLHQVATEEGISLMDWMWERRLVRAHTMLKEPANQTASVQSVAFQCGFVDQAHFSRRFKQRFGQSPREFYRSARITSTVA